MTIGPLKELIVWLCNTNDSCLFPTHGPWRKSGSGGPPLTELAQHRLFNERLDLGVTRSLRPRVLLADI